MTDLVVNINKTIEVPIDKVFDAWLDPKMLAKFMLPMPGMKNSEVENNACEGGRFSIIMQVGENKVPHTGEYISIQRPTKIVFTWESPESIDDSQVEINFTEMDDKQTKIELTHTKFIDEKRRSNHEGGWENILAKLNVEIGG